MNHNVNILYFASLGERLGVAKEVFNINDEKVSVGELKNMLAQRGNDWKTQLLSPTLQCALNQTISDNTAELKDGDEIAFFPPVTGG